MLFGLALGSAMRGFDGAFLFTFAVLHDIMREHDGTSPSMGGPPPRFSASWVRDGQAALLPQ